jgi:rhodanese-related sulfurtransferase
MDPLRNRKTAETPNHRPTNRSVGAFFRFFGRFRFGAASLVFVLLAYPVRAEPGDQVSSAGPIAGAISAQEALVAMLRGETQLIDVREPFEIRRAAPGWSRARIPYRLDGSRDTEFVTDVLQAVAGNRLSDITLICATGVRSAAARDLLLKHGFTRVRSLTGGFEAWQNGGLPTVADRRLRPQ